jgi:hypothetical protein
MALRFRTVDTTPGAMRSTSRSFRPSPPSKRRRRRYPGGVFLKRSLGTKRPPRPSLPFLGSHENRQQDAGATIRGA